MDWNQVCKIETLGLADCDSLPDPCEDTGSLPNMLTFKCIFDGRSVWVPCKRNPIGCNRTVYEPLAAGTLCIFKVSIGERFCNWANSDRRWHPTEDEANMYHQEYPGQAIPPQRPAPPTFAAVQERKGALPEAPSCRGQRALRDVEVFHAKRGRRA